MKRPKPSCAIHAWSQAQLQWQLISAPVITSSDIRIMM